MTPWAWYWRGPFDDSYGEECDSRDAVIASALRDLKPGEAFDIVEARMSEDRRHEGSDFIPFLRTRNAEKLVVSPDGTSARAATVPE